MGSCQTRLQQAPALQVIPSWPLRFGDAFQGQQIPVVEVEAYLPGFDQLDAGGSAWVDKTGQA